MPREERDQQTANAREREGERQQDRKRRGWGEREGWESARERVSGTERERKQVRITQSDLISARLFHSLYSLIAVIFTQE